MNEDKTPPEGQEKGDEVESPLLYRKEDGTGNFVHETIRDFFLARYHANKHEMPKNPLEPENRQIALLFTGMTDNPDEFIDHLIGDSFDTRKDYRMILPSQSIELAVAALKDNPNLKGLRESLLDDLIGVLLREKHIDYDDKSLALKFIGGLGTEDTAERLTDILESEHPKRYWTMSALGNIGKKSYNQRTIDAINAYMVVKDNTARFWGPPVLEMIQGEDAIPMLLEYIFSKDVPMNYAALRSLAQLKRKDMFNTIGDRRYEAEDSMIRGMLMNDGHFEIINNVRDIMKPYYLEIMKKDTVH